jgi:hypothetical protein
MATFLLTRLLQGILACVVAVGAWHHGPGGHHGGHDGGRPPSHHPSPPKRCRLLPASQQPHVPRTGRGTIVVVIPATTCNTR